MPQKKVIKSFEDVRTINLHNHWEIENWCNVLNCSPQQLAKAVNRVGTSAEAVRQEIAKLQGRDMPGFLRG